MADGALASSAIIALFLEKKHKNRTELQKNG